jgi:TRAP-type C4-dicarboxylate transport system permease small subunit
VNAAAALLRWMQWLEQAGTSLAFATMVLVLGLDIVGREFFGSGKIWATPIAVYCNVFIAFIGMGVASSGGAHLRPRFFDKLAPKAMDAGFDRLTDAGFALFCAGAGVLCWRITIESVKLQETDPVLQWQIWPFQVFLIAAFGLATLRHAVYALWPQLRPAAHGGENAPPTQEQIEAFAPTQEKAR